MVTSITEYVSFFEAGEDMTNEEYGIYMRAIHNFAFNDIEPDYASFPPLVKAALRTVIASVRKNKEDRENGRKGGKTNKTTPTTTENKGGYVEKIIPPLEKKESKEKENENENENENLCMTVISDEMPSPKAEPKHKHGQFSHVLITDSELEKLHQEYGRDRVDKAITFLDEYIEMKGYKAKSHYLALKKWVFQAVSEQERRNGQHIPDSVANMEVY